MIGLFEGYLLTMAKQNNDKINALSDTQCLSIVANAFYLVGQPSASALSPYSHTESRFLVFPVCVVLLVSPSLSCRCRCRCCSCRSHCPLLSGAQTTFFRA